MKYFLLKVSSFTDVITNSSTECFIIKKDSIYNEIMKVFPELDKLYTFNNEEELREFVRNRYEYGEMNHLTEILNGNPIMDDLEKAGPDTDYLQFFDGAWERHKDFYKPLMSFAYRSWDTDGGYTVTYGDELLLALANITGVVWYTG